MFSSVIEEIKALILSEDEKRLITLKELLSLGTKTDDLFACLDFDEAQRERLASNPQWMAKVYDHFARACGDEAEPVVLLEGDAHLADIGRTFVQLLLHGLPGQLRTFAGLDQLPLIDAKTSQELRVEADVAAAGAIGRRLADYGLRPAAFHLAMNAVATLIDDLCEDGELRITNGTIRLYLDPPDGVKSDGIDFREAANEIALATRLDLHASPQEEEQYGSLDKIPLPRSIWLLSWLTEVALIKPLLFPGYMTTFHGKYLLLAALAPQQRRLGVDARWTAALTIKRGTVISDRAGFPGSIAAFGVSPEIAETSEESKSRGSAITV